MISGNYTPADPKQPDFQTLIAYLRQWHGRRRLADAVLWLPRGVLAGLLLAAAMATVARLRPFLTNSEVATLTLGLAGAGLLVALIVVAVQRRSLAEQARFADHHFQLQERVSTAVEIAAGRLSTSPILAQQQLADTLQTAGKVDFRAALPLRLSRQHSLILLTLTLLLGAAVLLPNPQVADLLHERAIDQSIAAQEQALAELLEEIEQNPDLSEPQKEELQQPIEGALEELQTGDLSQEEAVAVLSEAEADLRELGQANNTEELRQRLNEAGQPLSDNPAAQLFGQALQAGDLSQAGAEAAALADSLPTLSSDEQAALAQDLAETAAALQDVDPELAAELAQAAQALEQGDTAAAQQALREAAATLQERAQEQATAAQAQTAADQLNQGRQEVAGGTGQVAGGDEQQAGGGEQGSGGAGEQGDGQSSVAGGEPSESDGQGAGGPGPGGSHAENVFVPEYRDLDREDGVAVELPAECRTNPAACGALISETPTALGDEQSIVPYSQVYGDYRQAAYEALADDYIPLGLKGYIRDYFSSLEP